MVLNIDDIKTSIMNSIKTYFYPMQTISTGSIVLDEVITINQTFIPFSSSIGNLEIYVSNIIGSPSETQINIIHDEDLTVASTLTSLSVGWNTLYLPSYNLVPTYPYTLQITGGINSDNDYILGCSDQHSYFYGTTDIGSILTFKFQTTEKVCKVYSGNMVSIINSLPYVDIDISNRPAVRDPYITGDLIREILRVKIEVNARTPREVDMICYGIERGINLNRKSFIKDAFKITPSDLSQLNFISPEIFYRDIQFDLDMFVSRE
jgi:hypothetical protein